MTYILSISCEITLQCMPQDFTVNKSTLVQIVAYFHQATHHDLNQCRPSSMMPYCIAGPQWHDDVIKWKHFSVIGPLCRESTSHQWIPLTKASEAELWCFLCSTAEKNSSVNSLNTSDLIRPPAHYDITVMNYASLIGTMLWLQLILAFPFQVCHMH